MGGGEGKQSATDSDMHIAGPSGSHYPETVPSQPTRAPPLQQRETDSADKHYGTNITSTTASNHPNTSRGMAKYNVAPTTSHKDVLTVENDRRPREAPATTTSEPFDSVPKIKKPWLDLQFTDAHQTTVRKPNELERQLKPPPRREPDGVYDRVAGSMLGMAIGDALGAHVEFRPHDFLVEHPVTDLSSGGTWGLEKGQFTDDTSMALCLANSLIVHGHCNLYDQLVRYKWWHKHGYMSSTGECFDIGKATKESIDVFCGRQCKWAQKCGIPEKEMDYVDDHRLSNDMDVHCSHDGVAGNGALMRLAPVPLFFFRDPPAAVDFAGRSGEVTHGDQKAIDSCRYYAALIVAALRNYTKDEILDDQFYHKHRQWFSGRPLHKDILTISQGSYKKDEGYESGIRGSGYTVASLEAALWAFWSTDTFTEGALAAVNLGDDTDTTAAIYGQLAGCFYGLRRLPRQWLDHVFAREFILNVSGWIDYEGAEWHRRTNPDEYVRPTPRVDERRPEKKEPKVTAKEVVSPEKVAFLPDPEPVTPKPREKSKPLSHSALSRPESRVALEETKPTGPALKDEDCKSWSSVDVYRWLVAQGKPLSDHADKFFKQKVTGGHLLQMSDKSKITFDKWVDEREKLVLVNAVKGLQRAAANKFNQEFHDADYALAMKVFEKTTKIDSVVLRPNDEAQRKTYDQIVEWMGEMPDDKAVSKIEVLYEPDRLRLFLEQVSTSEMKKANCYMEPHLDKETNPGERRRVLQQLERLKSQVQHRKHIAVARVWYGCTVNDVKKFKQGFNATDKTRKGKFGDGFYLNSSALRESYRAGATGCLIMCYVILVNPFPVIADDAPSYASEDKFRFYGGTARGNYDSHYIPVARVNTEKTGVKELPPPNGVQDAEYDRIVIFNPSNILPQCVVHLKPQISPSEAEVVSPSVSSERSRGSRSLPTPAKKCK